VLPLSRSPARVVSHAVCPERSALLIIRRRGNTMSCSDPERPVADGRFTESLELRCYQDRTHDVPIELRQVLSRNPIFGVVFTADLLDSIAA
jgi:hypothetical protein